MNVYSTPQFIRRIELLQHHNAYADVLADICQFLAEKDIHELHQMVDVLKRTPGIYSLNKHRIPNRTMNKGKSGSYRCISVCLPQVNAIYLGYIYPKTGPEGVANLVKEDYQKIAK